MLPIFYEESVIPMRDESACILLAAGQSSRMKQAKLVMPWGNSTVIGKIIRSFLKAGVKRIVVVTGGYRVEVEHELARYPVETVYNPDYENGEMTDSLKIGIDALPENQVGPVFIALGDQPLISANDLKQMLCLSRSFPEKIVIPSQNMRRGHPWLVASQYLDELKNIMPPETLRNFIQRHEHDLEYYLVKDSDILSDLDTPEDYQRLHSSKG
jgi:molybdenum cofactor cytidylyltransferase